MDTMLAPTAECKINCYSTWRNKETTSTTLISEDVDIEEVGVEYSEQHTATAPRCRLLIINKNVIRTRYH